MLKAQACVISTAGKQTDQTNLIELKFKALSE